MGDQGIFSSEELQAAVSSGEVKADLPPPGDARREELKRRGDVLEEQAETAGAEGGRIPEEFLKPIHEAQRDIRHRGVLEIGVDNPYYQTKWVNFVNVGGTKVYEAQNDGWVVANARVFPDGKPFEKEDGTIRFNDTILMFMPIDQYILLRKRDKDKALRQQFGAEAEVYDLANKYPGTFKVHGETTGGIDPDIEARMQKRGAAQRIAARNIGNRMKEGPVPGIPMPGSKE